MARPVVEATLQSAASSTGNGTAVQLNGRANRVAIYIEWSSGVSAGAVTIEEAANSDYSGTWSAIQAVSTGAASSCDVVHLDGAHLALRARISTAVVGGTVTVRLVAQGD